MCSLRVQTQKHVAQVSVLICKMIKDGRHSKVVPLSTLVSISKCPSFYVSSPILSFLLDLIYLFQFYYSPRKMAPSSETVSVIELSCAEMLSVSWAPAWPSSAPFWFLRVSYGCCFAWGGPTSILLTSTRSLQGLQHVVNSSDGLALLLTSYARQIF